MTTAAKGRDDAWTGTRSCCVLGSHLGRQRRLRHQYRGQTSSPSPPGLGDRGQTSSLSPLASWEQEFPHLSPVKRRGNRRYYKRADVITIRQIRSLLYDQGYTIGGAKQQLSGVEAKDDISQHKQLIRQMIRELEEVLAVM